MEDLTSWPVLTAAAVVVVCVYLAALPKPIPGIPYHKISAWRPLGDVLDLLAHRTRYGNLSGLLPKRVLQLDSPIVQMFVQPLGRPWIIVADPQEAYDVLTHRTKEFDRSEQFRRVFLALVPENQVHMPTGPEWKAHRWLVRDVMSPKFLNGVAAPLFMSTAQELITLWKAKAAIAGGRPFSTADDISSTALEIVWHATFGFEPGALKAQIDLVSGIDQLSTIPEGSVKFPQADNPPASDPIVTLTDSLELPVNSLFPILHHYLALRTVPKLIKSRREKDKLIRERIAIAKEKVAHMAMDDHVEKYGSAIDLVMHREKMLAAKEDREPNYESRTIEDELFGLLFAGHETTSTTICWGLKFLGVQQVVQDKLRSALQQAYSPHKQPSLEDILSKDVPYLDATLAEINRLALTAPMVSRTALVDTTILGRSVPKGTMVWFLNNGPGIRLPAMSIDEATRSRTSLRTRHHAWDPDTIADFIPERWLKNDKFDAGAGPSLPFGAGQRACFGRNWAQMELRFILTLIVWNFKLLPVTEKLSSFRAVDKNTCQPQQCFVRLEMVS